ncbi:hypothetical protein E3U55_08200 [Filobacillus milosensis]|uniref:Uncharacterized protein n=1 Tax=Filobacillus milosensis TaxID=94137 RepID=A0A4Y8IKX8_9BACI|nr:hypothetical protein [Filobacillus milosensis]TFB21796.1 hypothetical protein E3U55_08200 [Filobacillus milosensis]
MIYTRICAPVEEDEEILDFYSWSTHERNLEIIEMYEYEVFKPRHKTLEPMKNFMVTHFINI